MDVVYEDAIFSVSNKPDKDPVTTLRTLCKGSLTYQNRHQMTEDDFIRDLGGYLNRLAENRIDLVEKWININTIRFQKCSEVQELYASFRSQAQTIRSQTIVCGMMCEQCGRRCFHTQRHLGGHHCDTDHLCQNFCSYSDDHSEFTPQCILPALHAGSHVCDQMKHLCREPCQLEGRGNCSGNCMKPINHLDGEHVCDARKHTCGQICALASLHLDELGTGACRGKCDIDHNQPHEQHQCERSGCPLQCALCGRMCGSLDHLHGLQHGSVHLCGDEHRCDQKCEMPGVCEVKSQPLSVEETYNGQLETFQYTMFTQQARRLHCAIPIPAGKLTHDGLHEHSRELHYCEARCPQCDYYCILPLGHPEQEHETSHGNMKNTKWLMEGDHAVISGRRYATGDNGVTMLCSVVCSELGRHSHRAPCKALMGHCSSSGDVEHILNEPPTGRATSGFDWISHKLFWERSGLQRSRVNR
ncbi:hypothetical protein M408DRAFT_199760 [Serendipita vermifera MAFF 305830]|uniref:Uncharacterized protein n=1 Tax=Serendipita vermifera MAFF 305830 TaxID=933852 RepID=A0A0C3B1K9_SERVB|nr:hypothetical protein M408DRAFT_199760 [Serendipita vermifera MAFF 305830]